MIFMKICIATDFHLSYRQYGLEEREHDFYKQYDKLINQVIKEKPQLFLILGDIFDTPYPKPIAIQTFNEGLKKLKQEGIKVCGIIGNHTLIQRKDYYPIDKVFEENYHIIDDSYMKIDDVFIMGLGYHPRTHNIKETIDQLYDDSEGCRLKILLLHQILEKDQPIGYDFKEEELGLERFDYVFLGHLHKRKTRRLDSTTIHYAGSINSCNVTEMLDEMRYGKGYTVLDTDTMELYHKTLNPIRECIQYTFKDDKLNEGFLDEALKSLKRCTVKPVVLLKSFDDALFNVYDMGKKLENDSLIVKCKTIPQIDNTLINGENEEISNFSEDGIEGMIMSSLDEDWKGDCAVALFRVLGVGDMDGAIKVADDVFRKNYH